MAEPFIKIDGEVFPTPSRPLKFMVSTLVDAARNANGVTYGQRVGRDLQKLDGLVWNFLDAETWGRMLTVLERFYVTVEYPDMVTGKWTTREMYCGDRTADPYWISEETGLPTHYQNCAVNLIDTGGTVV